MTNLGDDAEEFFRSGDEGTYEGGPASSIAPCVFEEPAADWDLRSADDWLERRRRLKRFVVTLVGALSAGLVILSVCLLAAHAGRADDATQRRQAATVPPAPKLRLVPAPGVTVQSERRLSPPEPNTPALEPEAKGAREPAPPPAPVARSVAPRRSMAVASRPRVSVVPTPTRPKAPANLPRASADLPPTSAAVTGRAPPTATFPN
jgi:hypothetical protein